jgi:DNA-binding LacI/PurR family transcriptional regulator
MAGRTAVITGTSTGIGRACALRLDAAGWDVFGTVRRAEDGEALRAEASRAGAEAVLTAAGGELLVRRAPHGREQARTLAAGLLASPDPPTAVIAASDLQALGVLEAAEAAGVRVPAELSVVGFDDVEVARYAGLTTVSQPLEESGVRGARLLLAALEGAPRSAQRLDLRLVVRATTGPPSLAARRMRAAPSVRHDGIVRPT